MLQPAPSHIPKRLIVSRMPHHCVHPQWPSPVSSRALFTAKLGIDKSTYNLYETATRPLTFETACLIRREFGIPVDWLFFGDMQPSALQTIAKIGSLAGDAPQPRKRRTG